MLPATTPVDGMAIRMVGVEVPVVSCTWSPAPVSTRGASLVPLMVMVSVVVVRAGKPVRESVTV